MAPSTETGINHGWICIPTSEIESKPTDRYKTKTRSLGMGVSKTPHLNGTPVKEMYCIAEFKLLSLPPSFPYS